MIAAAAILTAAACYSSSYARETAANVALIVGLSDKLADYCGAGFVVGGRPVSSEEMGEFYYALKKARAFSAMTSAESARPSYRGFGHLLDAYEAFVHAADEYRLAGGYHALTLAALLKMRAEVSRVAAEVNGDLKAESR